ncbi:helix-hairpin-helix domain-containing protein [Bacillus sp. Bva_UNVM-123]|uniref:helix-hairpin-helix domain-containing protein n=1 Tax=Bacillus sp. Bva_UNVM-123 TaxID=2829798 RepID=UPI00391F6DF1
MFDWIRVNKVYIIGVALVMAVSIYFLLKSDEEHNVLENDYALLSNGQLLSNEEADSIEMEEEIIIVDVKGAVLNPGVYEAAANDRVIDMITKAGGLNEHADESRINFAIRVEDEMVIYVPIIGEEGADGSDFVFEGTASKGKNDGKVNLNTANETELQTLPGIGPAKAAMIIEYREKNGPFKAIEDLKLISGIGDKTFEKLQSSIKVK